MVRRYAHLAADHLAAYAGKVEPQDGHKSVTATLSLKTDVTVSPRIEGKFMVARGANLSWSPFGNAWRIEIGNPEGRDL